MRKTNLVLSECFTMTHNERSLVLAQHQRRNLNSEENRSYEERRKTSRMELPKRDDFDVRSISSHRSPHLMRSISNDFGLKHGKFLRYLCVS